MPDEYTGDPEEYEGIPEDPFTDSEVDAILRPEVDPSVVAHLDQEEAAWASEREEFGNFYGFDHECTCAHDYSEGKTGTVTQCFMKLTSQALASSAEKMHELRLMTAMLEQMLKINNDLVKMMQELGHTEELQEYFSSESDEEIDAPEESELEDTKAEDTDGNNGDIEDGADPA